MDRTAMEDYSISEVLLMENAASATCNVIKEKYTIEGKNFLILCGTGNNGGDGLALARLLYSEGGAPLVLLNGQPDNLKETALYNYNILKNFPFEIISRFSLEILFKEIEETDIIVDAMLGTGISREITGKLKEIIKTVNDCTKPVISLDIPTGINGDTGQVLGAAVSSEVTISFGALKPGNILYPGYAENGELCLSRISLPPEIYNSDDFLTELNICPPLPPRDEAGYKKTFGDILTISGAATYYGAPVFSASAVLKSGSGYSRLAAPASMIPFLAAKLPEAVFLPMNETVEKSIALSNLSELLRTGGNSDGVIIGPGLSLNMETSQLICDFVRLYKKFIIIDGDGLSAIAGKPQLISHREIPAVLTPHFGEMSRLMALSVEKIKKDPLKVLRECCVKYRSIVVLKGAHSLIGLPDGHVYINTSGNSGLGTAGSGDILTGIIAAFFGLGLSVHESVKCGVFIHGAAGDLASEKYGKDGITASNILDFLPFAIKKYRENYKAFVSTYIDIIHIV